MERDYDVLIVGGGTAGATLAILLAKAGVKVGIIDRRKREDIGNKICGDAVASHHFTAINMDKPRGKYVLYNVRGLKIFPHDMNYYLIIYSREGGYIVDRHRYGQYLINEAEKYGTTIITEVNVIAPIIKENYVIGIKGIKSGGGEVKYYGKVIVDASGYQATLVMRLPDEWGWEKKIDIRDKIIGYREIIELGRPFDDNGYLWIHYTDRYAPGGYVWIFPHSNDGYIANVGNGLQAGMGYPKPWILLSLYKRDNVVTKHYFENSKILNSGQWPIPSRRPRGMLVGNGFLAIGDAAIQIDPATAEGIGYGLYGAYIASKHIINALENRDVSMGSLWGYAYEYMTSKYGINQARFDVFRYLLQASGDDAKIFAIKHNILGSEEMSKAKDGDISIDPLSKGIKVLKSLFYGKLNVIKTLDYTIKMMRIVAEHYKNYPEKPDKYSVWKKRELALFEEIKNVLKPYKPPYFTS